MQHDSERKKLFDWFYLVSSLLLSGCAAAPQTPSRPLTPLEACVKDAIEASNSCHFRANLSTLGSGQSNQSLLDKCDDRRLMQIDRCHARYKKN